MKNNQSHEMHFAYTVNLNTQSETGFLASLTSLSRHLRQPQLATVHLAVSEGSEASVDRLLACWKREFPRFPAVKRRRALRFGELSPAAQAYAKHMQHVCTIKVCGARSDLLNNSAMWLSHLFFEQQFPTLQRLVYVDSDTIVTADVAELFWTDMHGHAFGGRPSAGVTNEAQAALLQLTLSAHSQEYQQLLPQPGAPFVNCGGSLLLDLEQWRDTGFRKRREFVLRTLATHQNEMISFDQSVLNILFCGRLLLLETRWNTPDPASWNVSASPAVLHFGGYWKPWTTEQQWQLYISQHRSGLIASAPTRPDEFRELTSLWRLYQPGCAASRNAPGAEGEHQLFAEHEDAEATRHHSTQYHPHTSRLPATASKPNSTMKASTFATWATPPRWLARMIGWSPHYST